jgi:hypothetical protein
MRFANRDSNRDTEMSCESVNGLPTELLIRIFYLGTHLAGASDPQAPLSGLFPVLASHVCRFWRSIALGSPSL